MFKLVLHLIGLFLLSYNANCNPYFTITTPKAFRLGAEETVIVNLHGYRSATVNAFMNDLPNLQEQFGESERLEIEGDTIDQPIELKMKIVQELGTESITSFQNVQKVRLTVVVSNASPASGNFIQQFPVLVSRDSGYLFVITDQPVYKPNDLVKIKVFTLDQTMAVSDLHVRIVVKTPPDNIGVSSVNEFMRDDNFVFSEYILDESPVLGNWTVEVTYVVNGYETTAETQFLVDRFVLPTFDVTATIDQQFITPGDVIITGDLYANYSFGEPVSGGFLLKIFLKKSPDAEEELLYSSDADNPSAVINNGVHHIDENLNTQLNDALLEDESLQTIAESKGYLFVKAAVRDRASGDVENYVSPPIPIISSPYSIDTRRSSRYFFPGLLFNFLADAVFTVGGEVAADVPYKILVDGIERRDPRDNDDLSEYTTDEHGQISQGLVLEGNGNKNVVIRVANAPQLAEVSLVLRPYSQTSKYLQISLQRTSAFTVSQFLRITFKFNQENLDKIRYLILARGSIVTSGTVNVDNRRSEVTHEVRVTQDMVPSGRIVAYYMNGAQIISDSLWFDVVDRCETELQFRNLPEDVKPREKLDLRLTGSPNALVSVTAVDRAAYFLYNSSRLTRPKMFDKMEDFDQGCSKFGGNGVEDVFWEAGLLLKSNNHNPRDANRLACPEQNSKKRRKRQATDMNEITVREEKLKKCNRTGLFDPVIKGESCEDRRIRIIKSLNNQHSDVTEECSELFRSTCVAEARRRSVIQALSSLGRSNGRGNAAELDTSLQHARKNFVPNMIFKNIELDEDGIKEFSTRTSDSISTFEINAVSMADEKNGFCVAKTESLKVFKKVFLQVIAPYSLKKLEQANLRIIIFNYDNEEVEVDLYVRPDKNNLLCTHYKAGRWTKMLDFLIPSKQSNSTILTVLPLNVPKNGDKGSVAFQVRKQRGRRRRPRPQDLYDLVKKEILIEESGKIEEDSKPFVIDPQNGIQDFSIDLTLSHPFVPQSRKCWLYGYSNLLGPSIEIDPVNQKPNDVSTFFRRPYGCGEQNMIASAPNVYAHMYLESSKQMRVDTPAHRASIQRIEQGYARELGHRSDQVQRRAFAVWTSYYPSTWLNAFVDKVFTKANEYDQDMDISPICTSLEWLLSKQNDQEGYFIESGRVIHREMHGAVSTNSHLTLTAYVVISLLEAPTRCGAALHQEIDAAVERAAMYLEENEDDPTFRRPYGLALLTYALILQDPNSAAANRALNRLKGLRITEGNTVHWEGRSLNEIQGTGLHSFWYQHRPMAIHVEATAYALLAIVTKARTNNPPNQVDLDLTRQIVIWLIQQRNSGGGFTSTQDTVIGLQALATYQLWIAGLDDVRPETNININFRSMVNSTYTWESNMRLTDDNSRHRESLDIPPEVINAQTIQARVQGVGEGILSYRCVYRTVADDNTCLFNVNYRTEILNEHEIEEIKQGDKNLRMRMTVTVTPRGNDTEMSIIEVGLLSGFSPVERTLTTLTTSFRDDGIVDRYEITSVSVVFYLASITSDPPTVLQFEMEQKIYIPLPEPAKIEVYDYYEPGIRCSTFYSIRNTTKLLTSGCGTGKKKVDKPVCKCVEGGCTICRNRWEQIHKTCNVTVGDRNDCNDCVGEECTNLWQFSCDRDNDFAFEIRIDSIDPPVSGDIFYTLNAEILETYRRGSQEGVERDQRATFLVRRDCFDNCKFQPYNRRGDSPGFAIGVPLLVIGSPPERVQRNGETIHQYRLGENSLIERVIPQDVCDRYENNNKCLSNIKKGKKETKKCKKHREFNEACERYKYIVDVLSDNGCD